MMADKPAPPRPRRSQRVSVKKEQEEQDYAPSNSTVPYTSAQGKRKARESSPSSSSSSLSSLSPVSDYSYAGSPKQKRKHKGLIRTREPTKAVTASKKQTEAEESTASAREREKTADGAAARKKRKTTKANKGKENATSQIPEASINRGSNIEAGSPILRINSKTARLDPKRAVGPRSFVTPIRTHQTKMEWLRGDPPGTEAATRGYRRKYNVNVQNFAPRPNLRQPPYKIGRQRASRLGPVRDADASPGPWSAIRNTFLNFGLAPTPIQGARPDQRPSQIFLSPPGYPVPVELSTRSMPSARRREVMTTYSLVASIRNGRYRGDVNEGLARAGYPPQVTEPIMDEIWQQQLCLGLTPFEQLRLIPPVYVPSIPYDPTMYPDNVPVPGLDRIPVWWEPPSRKQAPDSQWMARQVSSINMAFGVQKRSDRGQQNHASVQPSSSMQAQGVVPMASRVQPIITNQKSQQVMALNAQGFQQRSAGSQQNQSSVQSRTTIYAPSLAQQRGIRKRPKAAHVDGANSVLDEDTPDDELPSLASMTAGERYMWHLWNKEVQEEAAPASAAPGPSSTIRAVKASHTRDPEVAATAKSVSVPNPSAQPADAAPSNLLMAAAAVRRNRLARFPGAPASATVTTGASAASTPTKPARPQRGPPRLRRELPIHNITHLGFVESTTSYVASDGQPSSSHPTANVAGGTSKRNRPAEDESMETVGDSSLIAVRTEQAEDPGALREATEAAKRYRQLISAGMEKKRYERIDVCDNSQCTKVLPEEVINCPRCQEARYCSKDCRLRDLDDHVVPGKCEVDYNRENTIERDIGMIELVSEMRHWLANGCETCANPACGLMVARDAPTCARCQEARYCSIRCHVLDWPRHVEGCRLFAGADAIDAQHITAMEAWMHASSARLTEFLMDDVGLSGSDDELELIMEEIEREGAKFSAIRVNRFSRNAGGGGGASASA